MVYDRLHMFGAAYKLVLGNWLIKTEAAYLDGFTFFNRPGKEFSRPDALFGFEYNF